MIYIDTSFLLPLFRNEANSDRVSAAFGRLAPGGLSISHWTRVEFASVISREVRLLKVSATEGIGLIEAFDELTHDSLNLIIPTAADFVLAQSFVKQFATKLRGPDALHLAIVQNHGLEELLSLDADLLTAASLLKIKARRGIKGANLLN